MTSVVLALLLAGAAAPVVTVAVPEALRITPGGRAQARVEVRVKKGFHVQANPASMEYLIPLTLELKPAHGLTSDGEPEYPPGTPHRLEGADGDLMTYAGRIELKVPVTAAADAQPGRHQLMGELRYQACNEVACLRPASAEVALIVEVGQP
jgi:DsbC/DsbD-like thiol-disulfide interchange protein